MVVYDDDIKPKVGFLPTGRAHGIANRSRAVIHGNDDRCLAVEVLLIEIGLCVQRRIYERTHLAEMLGANPFHFLLHPAIARIHIVELPLALLASPGLLHRVEILVQMEKLTAAREKEAQVVKSCKAIVGMRQGGIFPNQRRADEEQLTEVEVIAKRPLLIVNDRMAAPLTALHNKMVGIDHGGILVYDHPQHAFQGMVTQFKRHSLLAQEHILALGAGRHS